MATVTVTNVEGSADATRISPISASKAAEPAGPTVIICSMAAVAAAVVGMWFVYKHNAGSHQPIGIAKSYVPYAGVIAVTVALERLLEPLSQYVMQGKVPPSTQKDNSPQGNRPEETASEKGKITAKQVAADSKSAAQSKAANPEQTSPDVQTAVNTAAADQAKVDTLRTKRAIVFWAIASICGMGISGGFGLFLLQSIATGHVNTVLDLAVTGLTIGAGTKPTHDLITSLQASSGSS